MGNPEDAIEDFPVVASWSTGLGLLWREEGLYQSPLLVGEVMARHTDAIYLTQHQLSKQTLGRLSLGYRKGRSDRPSPAMSSLGDYD